MGLTLTYSAGQSPLSEEEKEGLKIRSISTHEELDEFEQHNIDLAREWLLIHKIGRERLLSEMFIKDLHRHMFGEVWTWAGSFRKSNKNIGNTDWSQVPIEIRKLLDDCHYWIKNQTFPDQEIAIRFSHRLVSVHPFPNGNGRHCRLMADLIMKHVFGGQHFSWGAANIKSDTKVRSQYLNALHKADKGDLADLIKFATS